MGILAVLYDWDLGDVCDDVYFTFFKRFVYKKDRKTKIKKML